MNDISKQDANLFLRHADVIDWEKHLIGMRIEVTDDDGTKRKVEVERAVFNVMEPWKMEINGHYLVSVLELAAKINGEQIPDWVIKEFDKHFSSAQVYGPGQSPRPRSPILLPGRK